MPQTAPLEWSGVEVPSAEVLRLYYQNASILPPDVGAEELPDDDPPVRNEASEAATRPLPKALPAVAPPDVVWPQCFW